MIFQLFLGNVEVIFNAYSWGGREGNQIATESQIIYFEVEFVVVVVVVLVKNQANNYIPHF